MRAEARAISRCPHCGQSLAWEPEPERVRWYSGERIATEEREPIILTPQEFQRYWRLAGRAARAAGGAR